MILKKNFLSIFMENFLAINSASEASLYHILQTYKFLLKYKFYQVGFLKGRRSIFHFKTIKVVQSNPFDF